ncbi:MAG: FhaA domain-containing protein [Candidatus Aquicultorales bacterium]
MSLIRDLERRFESILEGFFARQFRSGLQPIEVAKRLAREMDDNKTVSVSRVYVPNSYVVVVGFGDAEKLLPFKAKLTQEFSDFLTAHAQREGYTIVGRPSVDIEARSGLGLGEFLIDSSLMDKEGEPEAKPVVEARAAKGAEVPADRTQAFKAVGPRIWLEFREAGKEYPLKAEKSSIGRSPENDIVLPDQSVSRRHAEIRVGEGGAFVRDLGSKNGTFVNGRKVAECPLKDKDEIKTGTSTLRFRSEPGV